MAHFAEIDENNNVLRVLVVDNAYETQGSLWCKTIFGGNWIQTSYNGRIRKNYAGVGYKYDPIRDAFIPPKPYESWILDEEKCIWKAPIPLPDAENPYMWDETTITWKRADIT